MHCAPAAAHPPAAPLVQPPTPSAAKLPPPQAYAARHQNMLVVGAVDMFDDHVYYSNWDEKVGKMRNLY